MKKIKIGILGFGNMGKTHLYALENLKFTYSPLEFEPVVEAIAVKSEKSCNAVRNFGIENAYIDEDAVIFNSDIDVIDICTPNLYHYETLKKAISSGKAIYCEKPLCVNYPMSEEICTLAEEKNIFGGVVFNDRFLASVMRAKEIIGHGKLGRILSFDVRYYHASAVSQSSIGWKQNADICGGGVLIDLGSHCIDMVRYLCGDFESVRGMSQIGYPTRTLTDGGVWQTNADEAFYITSKLKCGACGTISVSKITTGTNDDLTFEIYGENGALKFNLMQPNYLYYYDGNTMSTSPNTDMGGFRGFTAIECVGRYPSPAFALAGVKAPIGWLRGHVGSYYNFLNCFVNGKNPTPSFKDGAEVMRVIDAAYKSDKEKGTEIQC